jgi:hypothetical protein
MNCLLQIIQGISWNNIKLFNNSFEFQNAFLFENPFYQGISADRNRINPFLHYSQFFDL